LNGVVSRINGFIGGINQGLEALGSERRISLVPDLDLAEIENRFEGAATAATTAAQAAFDRAFEDNPLTAPDLGLTAAANTALATANTYRGAARNLAESARAPLESWQALRDAVRGTDEDGADALAETTAAAERLETALGQAGRAATGAGAAAGAAAAAAEPNSEAAVTGWQAVTAALSDYASKAREIGGDIGQSLVGAFQSAETAVGNFVKTGKLDFRDMVTSMIADLAQLAARRFILGPIANALSGVFSGAGGIFASVLHAGGMVGSAGPSRMVPAMAFAAGPRMHGGGMAGLRHDEVPAILQRGERVLSRREAQSYGAGGGVNVTIMARDAESFRQSRTQVAADIARAVSLGRRGM
ncbi:phage tail tape measure C-terminal domain-containing protein, partial [Paracoccus sanguinis]